MLNSHSIPAMLESMRAHPKNYITLAKQTTLSHYTEDEAIMCGLWASGLAGNWGTNPDSWAWWETGKQRLYKPKGRKGRSANDFKAVLTMPEAELAQVMLQSAVSGATVFSTFESNYYAHYFNGKTTPCFERVIIPTIRTILAMGVIPSRDEALTQMKVAWWSDKSDLEKPSMLCNNDTFSSLRFTGRYGLVPILIAGANESERGNLKEILNISDPSKFANPGERTKFFDARYPSIAQGTGFAHRIAVGKWFIQNSHENKDISQFVELPIAFGSATMMRFDLPPHTYAVIRESTVGIDMHVGNYRTNRDTIWNDPKKWGEKEFNEYLENSYIPHPDESPVRTSVFAFQSYRGKQKPKLDITGANGYTGFKQNEIFDPVAKTYSLSLTHNGPVEIKLTLPMDNNTETRPKP